MLGSRIINLGISCSDIRESSQAHRWIKDPGKNPPPGKAASGQVVPPFPRIHSSVEIIVSIALGIFPVIQRYFVLNATVEFIP